MEKEQAMQYDSVDLIYFSPTGGTKKVADALLQECNGEKRIHDILYTNTDTTICPTNNLTIAVMPVYVGRVPSLCIPSLNQFKGNNTPAIAVVVYSVLRVLVANFL